MKLPRRNFLHLAASAAALPAVSRIAWAQTYPSRPVRIIVPFPAGQATDTIARLMGQSLLERLGQPFVIENRTGAGGNMATESVVRATPDGYTLLLVGLPNAGNATLYSKLNFNFIRDIAPVASIGGGPYVMVVNPSVPAKTVPEFIAYAKANPGKINMGSSGSGAASHVFGERFKMMTGINLVHVPYRGAYLPDLLSGQVVQTSCFPRSADRVGLSVKPASRHPAPGSGREAPGSVSRGRASWGFLRAPGHPGGAAGNHFERPSSFASLSSALPSSTTRCACRGNALPVRCWLFQRRLLPPDVDALLLPLARAVVAVVLADDGAHGLQASRSLSLTAFGAPPRARGTTCSRHAPRWWPLLAADCLPRP